MIAAVGAVTSRIRVGSGGVMLPNHSPLKVAETFRVLEGLHPGRVDLEEELAELRAYVDGFPPDHPVSRIRAMPDDVPLPPVWILGSSLYGGQAAAMFGTGFAFAGHFATVNAAEAVAGYRSAFQPSESTHEPHVILGAAALVAQSDPWTVAERSMAEGVRRMVSVGTPEQVADDLRARVRDAGADEVMVTTAIHNPAERRLSFELLARVW